MRYAYLITCCEWVRVEWASIATICPVLTFGKPRQLVRMQATAYQCYSDAWQVLSFDTMLISLVVYVDITLVSQNDVSAESMQYLQNREPAKPRHGKSTSRTLTKADTATQRVPPECAVHAALPGGRSWSWSSP